MDEKSSAYLDGDRLFQRHAAIVTSSTGSGKSYCVARIVEQMADLPKWKCCSYLIYMENIFYRFLQEGRHCSLQNRNAFRS